jgi:hypothetical protein
VVGGGWGCVCVCVREREDFEADKENEAHGRFAKENRCPVRAGCRKQVSSVDAIARAATANTACKNDENAASCRTGTSSASIAFRHVVQTDMVVQPPLAMPAATAAAKRGMPPASMQAVEKHGSGKRKQAQEPTPHPVADRKGNRHGLAARSNEKVYTEEGSFLTSEVQSCRTGAAAACPWTDTRAAAALADTAFRPGPSCSGCGPS